jgi:hypothetical protein
MAADPFVAYEQLKELIDAPESKELESRDFLHHAKEALVRDTVLDFVYVEKERRAAPGDSDYIISCKVCDETGVQSVKAYVWELKAPQCHLFEKDTENRLRPTRELLQAENQLLHYYHEHRGNDEFRREFGVTHPDNVLFGGIIIGCQRCSVKGDYPAEKKAKLFEKALFIRKHYFYERNNMKIFTWDFILDQLKPRSALVANPVQPGPLKSELLDPERITLTST